MAVIGGSRALRSICTGVVDLAGGAPADREGDREGRRECGLPENQLGRPTSRSGGAGRDRARERSASSSRKPSTQARREPRLFDDAAGRRSGRRRPPRHSRSTTSVAFALAERGAADRHVVVADQQLAGTRRRGRTWSAPTGTRPAGLDHRAAAPAQALLSTLSLYDRGRAPRPCVAGDSRGRAAQVAERRPRVGRKIAGILLESRMAGIPPGRLGARRVGDRDDHRRRHESRPAGVPGDLADSATSVALETGTGARPRSMLTALLEEFDAWRHGSRAKALARSAKDGGASATRSGAGSRIDGVTGTRDRPRRRRRADSSTWAARSSGWWPAP